MREPYIFLEIDFFKSFSILVTNRFSIIFVFIFVWMHINMDVWRIQVLYSCFCTDKYWRLILCVCLKPLWSLFSPPSIHPRSLAGLEPLTIALRRITMVDYDQHHYDKEVLMRTAVDCGAVVVNPISDLENVRGQINKHLLERGGDAARLSADWCFVDSECEFSLVIDSTFFWGAECSSECAP